MVMRPAQPTHRRHRTGLLAAPATARLGLLPRTYTVRAGDTLTGLASAWLGDATRWVELYEANRDKLGSPNVLPEGLVLRMEPRAVVSNAGGAAVASGLPTWLQELINDTAARHGLDAGLLAAVVLEASAGDPGKLGVGDRQGLMQLAPDTARALRVTHPLNPRQNMEGGARCLAFLLGYYNQRQELALAAFWAGVGQVDRYGGLPPCARTRAFVAAVQERLGQGSRAAA